MKRKTYTIRFSLQSTLRPTPAPKKEQPKKEEPKEEDCDNFAHVQIVGHTMHMLYHIYTSYIYIYMYVLHINYSIYVYTHILCFIIKIIVTDNHLERRENSSLRTSKYHLGPFIT